MGWRMDNVIPNADATSSIPDVPDVPDVLPMQGAGSERSAENPADVPSVPTAAELVEQAAHPATPVVPAVPTEKRPQFAVYDEWCITDTGVKLKAGVYLHSAKENKDELPTLTDTWICSPLHLMAQTRDGTDNNFGRLLRFKTTKGGNHWRVWSMPMELLKSRGDELRGELLSMGMVIDPSQHRLLSNYLQHRTPNKEIRCTLQVGWCGHDAFVLPDEVIGPGADGVIFQSGERNHEEHGKAGTLDGWRAEIGRRAVNNPLFILALSAAFAGPLLKLCNAEGGGLHFVGDSSTGKTTILLAACSVWGGEGFKRSWRTTANGMEGAAALFNDCLLALDEISECNPVEVGSIVYALGNGTGKQRANRSGAARSVTRWLAFVLSTGERTIGTTMQEGGKRTKAGQSMRLLDIPAARKHGCFDDLHGMRTGTALSDAIKAAAKTHHGHAGRAFVNRLARDPQDFAALLERFKGLAEFNASDLEGQEKRGVARFALLALAGETATDYGITGWQEGDALNAAVEGFKVWRAARGGGNDERRQIRERLSDFIERHGDSRFSDAMRPADETVRDRAGWWRDDPTHGRIYLLTKTGIREALQGFDLKRALDSLEGDGVIPAGNSKGERSRPQNFGGRKTRVYEVRAELLAGGDGNC